MMARVIVLLGILLIELALVLQPTVARAGGDEKPPVFTAVMVQLLMLPDGRYQESLTLYPTLADCNTELEDVRKAVPELPGVLFALACLAVKPTDSKDI